MGSPLDNSPGAAVRASVPDRECVVTVVKKPQYAAANTTARWKMRGRVPGVRGPGVRAPGVWKTRGLIWKTRGTTIFRQNMNFPD